MKRLPRAVRGLVIAVVAIAVVVALILGAASVTTFAQDTLASSRAPGFQAIIIPSNAGSELASFAKVLSPLRGGRPIPTLSELGTLSTQLGQHSLHGEATVSEAEAHVGAKLPMPHHLPAQFAGVQPTVYLGDAGTVDYALNVAKADQLLSAFHASMNGLPDPNITPTVTFVLNVPPSAAYVYQTGNSKLAVGVVASPTMTVPSSVNLDEMRNDVLSFPALPPVVSNELHSIHDWQRLLVIPLPAGATDSEMTVHASPALLVQDANRAIVVWQSNGILYFVAGEGITGTDAVAVAASVQE